MLHRFVDTESSVVYLKCVSYPTFHQQMSVCFLPRYTINFMVVIMWWMVMKWKWSFARRELLSSFQSTGILATCPSCTVLSRPKISRGNMTLSSGLLFMWLGFMQPSITLPTSHLTKICQRGLGCGVSFQASRVLEVWRMSTYWCFKRNYSSRIGN